MRKKTAPNRYYAICRIFYLDGKKGKLLPIFFAPRIHLFPHFHRRAPPQNPGGFEWTGVVVRRVDAGAVVGGGVVVVLNWAQEWIGNVEEQTFWKPRDSI